MMGLKLKANCKASRDSTQRDERTPKTEVGATGKNDKGSAGVWNIRATYIEGFSVLETLVALGPAANEGLVSRSAGGRAIGSSR